MGDVVGGASSAWDDDSRGDGRGFELPVRIGGDELNLLELHRKGQLVGGAVK